VRFDLANGNDVDDLVQDVAVAFVHAVRRGRVAAARPAIYRWFQQTVCFLVPERARQSALSGLTGASLTMGPSNDNGSEGEPSSDELLFGGWPTPEEACARVEGAQIRTAGLTPGQREVVVLQARGAGTAEIAQTLGITEGAVRLRLMQARRRLRG
jgi:DNA-directed RNA polymerase specialized sigma24 family protein